MSLIGKTRNKGFTLIELMVVMTLLAIVISISVPSLSSFFRGRTLDGEARRLLALTHAGQSRAVSEGVPMVLWVDVAQRAYGLEEEPGYTDRDPKARDFTVDRELQIQVPNVANTLPTGTRRMQAANAGMNNPHRNLPQVRFMPDGTVDEGSPSVIMLMDRGGSALWLTLARTNRMNYEIRSQQ
jgi:type II secretion system protein H